MRNKELMGGGLILALIILVSVGFWQTAHRPAVDRIAVVSRPRAVMGTSCMLAAIAHHPERRHAEEALEQAERTLRAVEARMSVWLADSEISRFNAAGAGEEVPLSPDTLEVLRMAREASTQTAGAFDVTCRPVIELWKQAGQRGVAPTETDLAGARRVSNWDLIELTDTGAIKRSDSACVDLGGIAKGYAIDRAAEALRRAGMAGGLVDVGGDLACFGRQADGQAWSVDVRNPFGSSPLARILVRGAAVATSGNYARYTEIGDRRYSHIVDPRTGQPAETTQSVTVVAPTATTADIWATALSVLGPEGLGQLPEGVEVLMVVGVKEDHQVLCTSGFHDRIEKPLPEGLVVWKANSE
jgi:thiamine biosynthesis lipoprotein